MSKLLRLREMGTRFPGESLTAAAHATILQTMAQRLPLGSSAEGGTRSLPGQGRRLSVAERALVHDMFGDAIRLDPVRIHRRKWFLFQPRNVTMAPRGHLHFHPAGDAYRDCFAEAGLMLQAHFIHEMVHVWQHQQGVNLVLRRHPFCRYHYTIKPGWMLARYGIEQQAEIVRHVFLLRHGVVVPGAPPHATMEAILPFGPRAPSTQT